MRQVTTEFNLSWDAGYIVKRKIDPYSFTMMHLGAAAKWRAMIIYDTYAKMFDNRWNVIGVYPAWRADYDEIDLLQYYIDNPHDNVPGIPVIPGQENYIVINGINFRDNPEDVYELDRIQQDHPEVKLFMHGSYSFKILFGLNFTAGDFTPRDLAGTGSIVLPSGKVIFQNRYYSEDYSTWVDSLGYDVQQLKQSPKERCKYNISSALWASRNFREIPNFKKTARYVRIDDPSALQLIKTKSPFTKKGVNAFSDGDGAACDFCSHWSYCRYFREGSVCSVPGSDLNDVADLFGTRDAKKISDGISKLLAVNVQRISEAREVENITLTEKTNRGGSVVGYDLGLDPELTKLVDSTIKNALNLAKLHQPDTAKDAGGIVFQVNMGPKNELPAGEIHADIDLSEFTPEVAAMAIKEIEISGVPREEITMDHVKAWVKGKIEDGG